MDSLPLEIMLYHVVPAIHEKLALFSLMLVGKKYQNLVVSSPRWISLVKKNKAKVSKRVLTGFDERGYQKQKYVMNVCQNNTIDSARGNMWENAIITNIKVKHSIDMYLHLGGFRIDNLQNKRLWEVFIIPIGILKFQTLKFVADESLDKVECTITYYNVPNYDKGDRHLFISHTSTREEFIYVPECTIYKPNNELYFDNQTVTVNKNTFISPRDDNYEYLNYQRTLWKHAGVTFTWNIFEIRNGRMSELLW